jgi:sugar phosphate isomerase/epimerase
MNLGIFAKTFRRETVSEIFAAVRGCDYSCTQFNMSCVGLPSLPTDVGDETVDHILSAAANEKVELSALSGTFNMAHPDSRIRAGGLVSLEALAAVCARLHIPVLTLCTGTRDPLDMWRRHPENASKEARGDFLDSLERAILIAEVNSLLLAIEPEPGNVIDSASAAWQLIKEIKSSRLKIILDPANLIKAGSASEDRAIIEEACQLLGDQVVLAHAKDRDGNGKVCPAGGGVVDFSHFLRCLQEVGFRGPLIVHGIDESEAAPTAHYLRGIISKLGKGADHAPL